ncbi:MAG: hypothetical protein EHM41_26700 [Chloroflexi bacterium]|nr:MAG: hypothetical protein EHM41_26700 [Chloroflexota bacterium]
MEHEPAYGGSVAISGFFHYSIARYKHTCDDITTQTNCQYPPGKRMGERGFSDAGQAGADIKHADLLLTQITV